MILELDDEVLQCIRDFEHYIEDESYAGHLAVKILELYKKQIGNL